MPVGVEDVVRWNHLLRDRSRQGRIEGHAGLRSVHLPYPFPTPIAMTDKTTNADDKKCLKRVLESSLQPIHRHSVLPVFVAVRAGSGLCCLAEMSVVGVVKGHAEVSLVLAPIQIRCWGGGTLGWLDWGSEQGPA